MTKQTLRRMEQRRATAMKKWIKLDKRISIVEFQMDDLRARLRQMENEREELRRAQTDTNLCGINGHLSTMRDNGFTHYENYETTKGWKCIRFFKDGVEYKIDPDDYSRFIPKEEVA